MAPAQTNQTGFRSLGNGPNVRYGRMLPLILRKLLPTELVERAFQLVLE